MKLSFEQLKSALLGVSYCTQEQDGVLPHRFAPFQEEFYLATNADFYKKTGASAGVQLHFKTNSNTLALRLRHQSGSGRNYAFTDIFVNGKLFAHLGSAENGLTEFSGDYFLEDGEKSIHIFFPWSTSTVIREIALQDGSSFLPLPRKKKMLMFGDSITHGYDALYPSNSYASILAERLGADAINKGIGGEQFVPELLAQAEEIDPALITVAYGTNDWNAGISMEEMENRASVFFTKLTTLYPKAKVYAISPIWRGDENKREEFPFTEIEKIFRRATENLSSVQVIGGYSFVEHNPIYFSPDILHPNDKGFAKYAKNLYAKLDF